MEPKITLFSRDKKKKIPIQPLDNSLHPVHKSLPAVEPEQEKTGVAKIARPEDKRYWQSPTMRPALQKKRRGKQETFSILLSIVGAVLVGVIMGISILSIFFSNESTYSKNSIDSHLYLPKNKDLKPVQDPLKVYLLQAGIFQHRAGAERKVRSYRTQGFAAVISETSPYRIYLGVSFDRNRAIQLAKQYQEKGINVFMKEHSVSFQKPNKSDSLSSIAQRSVPIVRELSRLSIEGMSKNGSVRLRPQLEKEYREILEEANRRKEFLAKEERNQMLKLLQALDQAVQSANESKVNPSQALMFQIQEGLVRYVSSVEQF